MVKGCEKRMIRLKSPESRVFEEVLFVLRDGDTTIPPAERDIVAEARAILQGSTLAHAPGGARASSLVPFLLGAALSAVALLPLLLF